MEMVPAFCYFSMVIVRCGTRMVPGKLTMRMSNVMTLKAYTQALRSLARVKEAHKPS